VALISAAMTDRCGAVLDDVRSHPVSASDIRRWRSAVAWPAPAGRDDPGAPAPAEFNPFAYGPADRPPQAPEPVDARSLERRLGIEPPRVNVVLNGGVAVTYTGVAIHPGDVIRSVTRLAGYDERSSATRTLLLTSLESRWTNQNGQLIKVQTMTTVRF
jgi:hypothetical protein